MKKPFLRLTTLMALALTASAEDSLPKTLMTQRGKLLVSEDFVKPLTPFTGVPSTLTGLRFFNGCSLVAFRLAGLRGEAGRRSRLGRSVTR